VSKQGRRRPYWLNAEALKPVHDWMKAFKRRMGWKFKWVSSHGSDFNRDYHVSFTEEDRFGVELPPHASGRWGVAQHPPEGWQFADLPSNTSLAVEFEFKNLFNQSCFVTVHPHHAIEGLFRKVMGKNGVAVP
jgi:hypothetical protein